MKRFYYLSESSNVITFLVHLSLSFAAVYPLCIPLLKILHELHIISQLPQIEKFYTFLAASVAYLSAILSISRGSTIPKKLGFAVVVLVFLYIISMLKMFKIDTKFLPWSFCRYLAYTTGLCLLLSVSALKIDDRQKMWLWVNLLIALSIVALGSFALHLRAVISNEINLLQPLNMFFHPNITGSLMGVGVLIATGLSYELKKTNRILYIMSRIAFFLFVSALLLTQSRAAWISLLISLPFLYSDSKHRLISFGLAAIFLVMFMTAIFLLPENLKSSIKFAHKFALSMEYRIRIWKAALVVFSQHPLFGIGIGGFILVPETLYNLPYKVTSTHNQYIEFLLETGVIGCTVFLYLIAATVAKLTYILKQKHHPTFSSNLIPVAVFIFLLVNFFFESRLKTSQFNVIFYTTLGLIWNLTKQSDEARLSF